MSAMRKSALFLVLTFVLSWSAAIGGHYAGLSEGPAATLVLVAMMAGPTVAALVCAIAFEHGRRIKALGLHFKPNWWWLAAWFIPIALAVIAVVVTVAFSERTYVDIGGAVRQIAAAQGQNTAAAPPFLTSTAFIVGASITFAALINTLILTFTEELGWRGYLHYLWRPSGFWRASLGTGLVWGLWHAPAIYFYGLNYPANRELGIALFTLFCILLSPIMTLVRDRGGSTWAAGVFHGTFNAVGGLTLLAISTPDFPWNGIVGIGGFTGLALAVALTALARPGLAPRPAQA